MPVVFSAEALADLAAIRDYIGADNPIRSLQGRRPDRRPCDRLESMPERGRPGLVPGTRELTSAWPYVIVYRISSPHVVEIIRIWHGAQDG